MMAMDAKGIAWVGDIYQRFENMCLEVEDTMFEVCLCHHIPLFYPMLL